MTMNKKWYWWIGSVALIITGFLLRKKGMELWHQRRHAES